MKIVCDTPNNKNKIGREISAVIKSPINSSFIVSPYISELSNFIDLSKIENLQIICNAESASCNPYTLLSLLSNKNIKIKSRIDIHAKVYFFDTVAFVTSANATSNGLSIGTIEAAVKLEDDPSLKEIKEWFVGIWSDKQSIDVSRYDASTWERLKSNWNLSNNQKAKINLYDLIVSKTVPANTSFTFWHDIDDTPDKKTVANKAKDEDIFELPKNNENWDYWIEDDNYSKKNNSLKLLEPQLSQYYNHVMINLKTRHDSKRVFHTECFFSRLLDKPITLKWKNKTLLLSLYRTDNIVKNIKIDKETIKLLNRSKEKNQKLWERYLESDDGRFGFCSTEQLYKLVQNCF
jgi:hypothetical protein